jgi:hypothetical protein
LFLFAAPRNVVWYFSWWLNSGNGVISCMH